MLVHLKRTEHNLTPLLQVEATSVQVKELYSQGGPEADESTNIFFVSVIIQFLVTFEVILLAKVSDVSKNQLDVNLKNRSEFYIDCWLIKRGSFNFQEKSKQKNNFQIDSPRQGKHRAFKTALGRV